MKRIKLTKGFYHDYCDWEHEIEGFVSDDLQRQIDEARQLLKDKPHIHGIDLHVPAGFLTDETEDILQEQCRYCAERISVYRIGLYFSINGKYDSRLMAEWACLYDGENGQ